MNTVQQQWLFTECLQGLLSRAAELGYQVTLAPIRLGYSQTEMTRVSLLLFLPSGEPVSAQGYRALGDWWKDRHAGCRWGGDDHPLPDMTLFAIDGDRNRSAQGPPQRGKSR